MANVPKSNLLVKSLGSFDFGKPLSSFDANMIPSQTNKENIMSLDNMAHTNPSPSELMDYEELEEKEIMSQGQSFDEMQMSSQEQSSEEIQVSSQEQDMEEAEMPVEVELLSPIRDIPPSDNESENSISSSLGVGLRTPTIVPRKVSLLSEPEDGELAYEDETSFTPKTAKPDVPYASAMKLYQRAKRFGLNISHSDTISESTLSSLYKSLEIPLDLVRSGKLRSVRLNTVHMRGVEQMDTTDVIQYFSSCEPLTIEWINNSSCNVVFKSDLYAAQAMLTLSYEIVSGVKASTSLEAEATGHKVREKEKVYLKSTNVDEDMEGSKRDVTEKGKTTASLFQTPVPPGKWRQGQSCVNAKSILLRFATIDDKKLPVAKKRNQSYRESKTNVVSPTKFVKCEYNGHTKLKECPNRYRFFRTSPLKKTIYQDCPKNSDDDDEKDILSAGGKTIRMHMYADDIAGGSWQTVSTSPKSRSRNQSESKLCLKVSCDNSSERMKERLKNDVPSRYKIWNPIAESMAKDAELAEQSQDYHRSSRFQRKFFHTDLRHKINLPPAARSKSGNSINTCVDLRKKLQTMKRAKTKSTHRSPLLISVPNKNPDDSESSP